MNNFIDYFCIGAFLRVRLFLLRIKMLFRREKEYHIPVITSSQIQYYIDKEKDIFSITGDLSLYAEEILIENEYNFKYTNKKKRLLLIWKKQ